MKNQQGFTLIELIVVILILGILSATALPKFVNISSDARAAAMKSVEGSMRSANSMIYAKAAVGNLLTGTSASSVPVTVNGTAVATAYGFATNGTELAKVMDVSSDFTTSAADIRSAGAPTPASCIVTYTAATSTTTPPGYVTTTTGC